MDAMSLTIFDQTDITTQQPPQLDTVAAAEHFQVNFSFYFTFLTLTSCYFYMERLKTFFSQEFVVETAGSSQDHDDTMEPSAAATLVLSAAATHELATATAGVDDTDNTQHNNNYDATDADIVSAASVIITQAAATQLPAETAANEDAATLEDVDDAKQQPVVVAVAAIDDDLTAELKDDKTATVQVNNKAAAAETDSQAAGSSSSSEDITSEIKDGEQSGETTATDTDTTTPIQMDSQ